MGRGQGFTLFVVIGLLLAAVAGLNYIQSQSAPTEEQVEQQEQAQLAAAAAKVPQGKLNTPPTMRPNPSHLPLPSSTAAQNAAAIAPPEDLVVGNPSGAVVLAVGYTMDPATERDPSELNKICQNAQMWAKEHPNETVKIICLDLPKDQLSNPADQSLPLGVSINGKTFGGCETNPGEGLCDSLLVSTVLGALK